MPDLCRSANDDVAPRLAGLTMGDAGDSRTNGHGASIQRGPGIEVSWCTCVVSQRMQRYFDDELPSTEVDKRQDIENVLVQMKAAPALGKRFLLLRIPRSTWTRWSERGRAHICGAT